MPSLTLPPQRRAALLLLVLAALLLAACGSDPSTDDTSDTGDTADAAAPDASAEVDAEGDAEGEEDAAPDAPEEPDVPEEPAQTLEVRFAMGTGAISEAAYGLSAPEAEGGPWTVYIESWEGGFTGCPEEGSPTPARTFILAGLPVEGEDQVGATGELSGTLLDYQGNLLSDGVFTRAEAITVEVLSATVCTACVGQAPPSHEAGRVALQVTATFPEGEIVGRLEARHCDSLDAP